ncbi:ankyrin repeat domain-containing protein [bacterium]|nr:ankyrin repeat domain-containing protein [bacterium]
MKKSVVLVLLLASFTLFGGGSSFSESDPLVAAINASKVEKVNELLKEEKDLVAHLNHQDYLGRTPLMWASYVNYDDAEKKAKIVAKRNEIATELINRGTNLNLVDKDGWSVLMWASWSGLSDIVKLLLEKGAKVDLIETAGWDALQIASFKGEYEIVKMLLDKGALQRSNKKGESTKDLAIKGKKMYARNLKNGNYGKIIALLSK